MKIESTCLVMKVFLNLKSKSTDFALISKQQNLFEELFICMQNCMFLGQ